MKKRMISLFVLIIAICGLGFTLTACNASLSPSGITEISLSHHWVYNVTITDASEVKALTKALNKTKLTKHKMKMEGIQWKSTLTKPSNFYCTMALRTANSSTIVSLYENGFVVKNGGHVEYAGNLTSEANQLVKEYLAPLFKVLMPSTVTSIAVLKYAPYIAQSERYSITDQTKIDTISNALKNLKCYTWQTPAISEPQSGMYKVTIGSMVFYIKDAQTAVVKVNSKFYNYPISGLDLTLFENNQ